METLRIIKDTALIFAALVGAWVAIRGLNTWKRQVRGQDEYELAKRILGNVYKFELAAENIRDPFLWETMSEDSSKEALSEALEKNSAHDPSYIKAYKKRADELREVFAKIWIERIEAEVLWGKNIWRLFSKLEKLNHWLLYKLDVHLDPRAGDPLTSHILDSRIDCDFFWDSPTTPDAFRVALSGVIKEFEELLRRHIQK